MSSLQKFHRRTQSVGPAPFSFTSIGSGNDTVGYWYGGAIGNRIIIAPKSTESQVPWGSSGTLRGATSASDGLLNTDTLVSFGTAAHPAAYNAKKLTTGGYNTWYLPAKSDVKTIFSNRSVVYSSVQLRLSPGTYYWCSTEINAANAWAINMNNGTYFQYYDKNDLYNFSRAIRRVLT